MDDTPELAPELIPNDDLKIAPSTGKKRKYRLKKLKVKRTDDQLHKRAARMLKAAHKAGLYAGLTHMNCADQCTPQSCVISNRGYCAHPYKGGLQRIDQNNLAAINRLNEAKEFLGPPKRI
jgi:hypothetical protein